MSSTRPRPKRLDLSTSTATSHGPHTSGAQTSRPSAPLTSRDSAGLAVQDVGFACLSPGFQTNDPGMREQLQRSLDVRDQQRQIIEARQKGVGKPGSATETEAPSKAQDNTLFGIAMRTPTTSKRKGPPPGLSIAAPAAAQFANDRVIQSAPLHQTFTGLRPGDQPYTRHSQLGPSGLSQTSHIHHVPATQTNNRLPPIADVFANDRLEVQSAYPSNHSPSQGQIPPPVPSPGFASHPPQPSSLSSRPREFRSAEDAVAGLSGGRDELMPKLVHYGGVQPPTPPSPIPSSAHPHSHQNTTHHQQQQQQQQHHYPATTAGAQQPTTYSPTSDPNTRPDFPTRTASYGRRRGREEYERDNGSPPQTFRRAAEVTNKRASFVGTSAETLSANFRRGDEDVDMERERDSREEGDWRRGMSGREKREEFLRLCERAWDLFHS